MILDTLAKASALRVQAAKKQISPDQMEQAARALPKENFPFEQALKQPGISFICEVKKAPPSKGVIAEDFPYLDIAMEYEAAGASAVSVLTEPEYFLGKNEYLREISHEISIPVLRKDFTVDSYQIYEAKTLGACAVLLICALLNTDTLKQFIKICDSLGISALVEAHNQQEIDSALRAGARIIGVNNRNLKTFQVDFDNSIRLRNLVPPSVLFVAESGVKTPDDIRRLHEANVNAVLIGEILMRSHDKKAVLDQYRAAGGGLS